MAMMGGSKKILLAMWLMYAWSATSPGYSAENRLLPDLFQKGCELDSIAMMNELLALAQKNVSASWKGRGVLSVCVTSRSGWREAEITFAPVVSGRWLDVAWVSCSRRIIGPNAWDCAKPFYDTYLRSRFGFWAHVNFVSDRRGVERLIRQLEAGTHQIANCDDGRAKIKRIVGDQLDVAAVSVLDEGGATLNISVRAGTDEFMLVWTVLGDLSALRAESACWHELGIF